MSSIPQPPSSPRLVAYRFKRPSFRLALQSDRSRGGGGEEEETPKHPSFDLKHSPVPPAGRSSLYHPPSSPRGADEVDDGPRRGENRGEPNRGELNGAAPRSNHYRPDHPNRRDNHGRPLRGNVNQSFQLDEVDRTDRTSQHRGGGEGGGGGGSGRWRWKRCR